MDLKNDLSQFYAGISSEKFSALDGYGLVHNNILNYHQPIW